VAVAHISYYTDPASPWSWALEPTIRKLKHEFGANLRFTYVLGGLAREFGDRERLISEWLERRSRPAIAGGPSIYERLPPEMAQKRKVTVSVDPPKHRLTSTERRQVANAAIATKQQELKREAQQRREKRALERGPDGTAPNAPGRARRTTSR
jgi:hypothetical protein